MNLPKEVRNHICSLVVNPWAPGKDWADEVYWSQVSDKIGVSRQHIQHLDYFEESQYSNIEQFFGALERFEGRGCPCVHGKCGDAGKSKERELGILNDFLDWFWNNTVLSITFG